VGAATARAVIDLTVVIDSVVAPVVRVECRTRTFNRPQHDAFLRNQLAGPTSGESLGFIDGPCLELQCHPKATAVFHHGTNKWVPRSAALLTHKPCGY